MAIKWIMFEGFAGYPDGFLTNCLTHVTRGPWLSDPQQYFDDPSIYQNKLINDLSIQGYDAGAGASVYAPGDGGAGTAVASFLVPTGCDLKTSAWNSRLAYTDLAHTGNWQIGPCDSGGNGGFFNVEGHDTAGNFSQANSIAGHPFTASNYITTPGSLVVSEWLRGTNDVVKLNGTTYFNAAASSISLTGTQNYFSFTVDTGPDHVPANSYTRIPAIEFDTGCNVTLVGSTLTLGANYAIQGGYINGPVNITGTGTFNCHDATLVLAASTIDVNAHLAISKGGANGTNSITDTASTIYRLHSGYGFTATGWTPAGTVVPAPIVITSVTRYDANNLQIKFQQLGAETDVALYTVTVDGNAGLATSVLPGGGPVYTVIQQVTGGTVRNHNIEILASDNDNGATIGLGDAAYSTDDFPLRMLALAAL